MTMGEKIDALYRLAEEKYDGHAAAEIFGLNKPVPETPKVRPINNCSGTSIP